MDFSAEECKAIAQLTAKHPEADRELLLRCLMARKFNVARAAALYTKYTTILVPQVGNQKIMADNVRQQLMTGEIMLPGTRDKDGAALVFYDARQHSINNFSVQQSLRAILFLMDRALSDPVTLRAGVTLVAFFDGLAWNQLDHALHKLLLSTLQDHYPARVHQVCIVSPNWVTKAVLKLCKPFMKSALAAKIRTFRNATALASAMDAEAVPSQLGGTLRYNHEEWLNSFVAKGDSIEPLSPTRSEHAVALVMSPAPASSRRVGRASTSATEKALPAFNMEDVPETDDGADAIPAEVLAQIEAETKEETDVLPAAQETEAVQQVSTTADIQKIKEEAEDTTCTPSEGGKTAAVSEPTECIEPTVSETEPLLTSGQENSAAITSTSTKAKNKNRKRRERRKRVAQAAQANKLANFSVAGAPLRTKNGF